MIQVNNLIGGKIVSGKQFQKSISPVDGNEISKVNFLSEKELTNVFKKASKMIDNNIGVQSIHLSLVKFSLPTLFDFTKNIQIFT